ANAILNHLWGISFSDAQSLLIGYLYLKPKYEALRESIRQDKYKQNQYELYENELMEKFSYEYKNDIEKVIANTITLSDIKEINNINLSILTKAFQLIPLKLLDESNKIITQKIISVFAEKLLSNERQDRFEYQVRHDFLE